VSHDGNRAATGTAAKQRHLHAALSRSDSAHAARTDDSGVDAGVGAGELFSASHLADSRHVETVEPDTSPEQQQQRWLALAEARVPRSLLVAALDGIEHSTQPTAAVPQSMLVLRAAAVQLLQSWLAAPPSPSSSVGSSRSVQRAQWEVQLQQLSFGLPSTPLEHGSSKTAALSPGDFVLLTSLRLGRSPLVGRVIDAAMFDAPLLAVLRQDAASRKQRVQQELDKLQAEAAAAALQAPEAASPKSAAAARFVSADLAGARRITHSLPPLQLLPRLGGDPLTRSAPVLTPQLRLPLPPLVTASSPSLV